MTKAKNKKSVKTSRKNLSGVSENDILLIWQYRNSDNKDVYSIHSLIDYRSKNQKPLGSLTLGPNDTKATVDRSNNLTGRVTSADLTKDRRS